MNKLQNLTIIAAVITIMGALAVAGIFATAIGLIFLPLYIALRKDPSIPTKPQTPPPAGNIIEADFKRLDKE